MPRSILGILLSFLAVVFGILTGILVKQLGSDINIVTVLFYRFLFSIPILFLFAIYVRGRQFLKINQRRVMIFRVIFGCLGITFWFLSLRHMPLGIATALFQSSVIFITLMSPIFLHEKVGVYRWSAVLTGLFGVLIITDPFSNSVSWSFLFGIGAALSGAVLSLLLRQLGKRDAPASVAIWYNVAGFVALSAIVLILPGQLNSISKSMLVDLFLLGVIGAGLQLVLTTAYRYSDAVVVASMRYLQMPISGVVGYFVFAEIMSHEEIIGALIIIVSCLVIAWREFVRSREVNQLDM